MGVKTGKGMLLCMLRSGGLVVAHVAGDCSLAAHRVNVPYLTITATISYLLLQSKAVITAHPPMFLLSPILCNAICTLVITIWTFPYVLRTVTIPWSPVQDRL